MVDRHDFTDAIGHAKRQIAKFERLSDQDRKYKFQLKSCRIILKSLEMMQETGYVNTIIKRLNDELDQDSNLDETNTSREVST